MITTISTILLLATSALANVHSPAHGRRHVHHGNAARNAELVRSNQGIGEEGNVTSVELEKRGSFSGRGTFFYVGLGACGQSSQDNDLMVALNTQQYGSGYPGPECFKWITVQANGITVSGVQILDECPTCDWGGLDMSPGLFKHFADEGAGVLSITWWFDDDSSQQSTTSSTWQAPTSSWTPTSTSTWQAPTTTWTPTTTSTWVAPSTSSTWTWSAPASSSSSTTVVASSSTFSTISSTTSLSSSATTASINSTSVNPYAVVQSYNATGSATASATGSTGEAGSDTGAIEVDAEGNLILMNSLITQYGQLIVVAAGGSS